MLSDETGSSIQDAITPIATDLQSSMESLLEGIPGVDQRPTALARELGVNRVIVSRLLSALRRPDPLEMLQNVPGPDSLRSIAWGARRLEGVQPQLVAKALASADAFAALIRDRFGTRGALHAAISGDSEALRKRHEETARYNIYNGMRHLMGVEGETWLTAMIFTPTPCGDAMTTTTLHGVVGMRRLRPDTPVRFSFGPPHRDPDSSADPVAGAIDLSSFYTNEAAPLESEVRDGRVIHQLATNRVGKDAVLDMLAVSRDDRGVPRYASPNRRLAGAAIFADVPVRTLVCDVILHETLVPPTMPTLLVYNPGARGPANPNDPSRDVDRLDVPERVETLLTSPIHSDAPGVANYGAMMERTFAFLGESAKPYRVHRAVVLYPVQGFQYVVGFEVPEAPDGKAPND